MILIEKTDICGWEPAIRGMRNPLNSWGRSDTVFEPGRNDIEELGYNDFELMKSLAIAGPVHAKYRRMITVYADITAPLYWWKEFDTYKVGTVANSCSTMHKIAAKEFELADFSCEHLGVRALENLEKTIDTLNQYRELYNNGGTEYMTECGSEDEGCRLIPIVYHKKDKNAWWQMIQLLPSSYNQKRTVMLNYEVLAGIYISRKNHKLNEWLDFCDWVEGLPYSEFITGKYKEEIE